MKALIGITASYLRGDSVDFNHKHLIENREYYLLDQKYCQAVERSGGLPIIIPFSQSIEDIKPLLDQLDGIIFSGGADIHPLYYGEEPQKGLGGVLPHRDQFEMKLMKYLLQKDKFPILAICRGLQILNVVQGGTLYQDLRKEENNAHLCPMIPVNLGAHSALVEKDSLLESILGLEKISVNSYHHQAIKKLGKNLLVNLKAPDGIIEGLEMKGKKLLALQWHPELMDGEVAKTIFDQFISWAEEA